MDVLDEEDPINKDVARVFTTFSPITLYIWELSLAMETPVPIRSGPKPNSVFPPTQ